MNLHGIVSGAIAAVNPLIPATLFISTGYTTGADGTQVPAYSSTTQMIQVQQMSAFELAQRDMINTQGNVYKVYLNGDWNGIVRPDSKGGDYMTFYGKNWLVTDVSEQWPDWTSVIVTRQF
jgi:hypothetical protein